MPAVERCGLCATVIDRRHGLGILCAGACKRRYHVQCTDPPLTSSSINEVMYGSTPWFCKMCMDNSHNGSSVGRNLSGAHNLSRDSSHVAGHADVTLNALVARLSKVEGLCEALAEENRLLRSQMVECLGLRTNVRAIEYRLDSVGSWSMTPGPFPNGQRFLEDRLESTLLNERETLGQNRPSSGAAGDGVAPSGCEDELRNLRERFLAPGSKAAGAPPGVPPRSEPSSAADIGVNGDNGSTGSGRDPRPVIWGRAKLANALPIAKRYRWLFLSRLSREVTEDQLRGELSRRLSSGRGPKCICLTSKAPATKKCASFRVELTDAEFREAISPDFWEEGIFVKPFLFRAKKKTPGNGEDAPAAAIDTDSRFPVTAGPSGK